MHTLDAVTRHLFITLCMRTGARLGEKTIVGERVTKRQILDAFTEACIQVSDEADNGEAQLKARVLQDLDLRLGVVGRLADTMQRGGRHPAALLEERSRLLALRSITPFCELTQLRHLQGQVAIDGRLDYMNLTDIDLAAATRPPPPAEASPAPPAPLTIVPPQEPTT